MLTSKLIKKPLLKSLQKKRRKDREQYSPVTLRDMQRELPHQALSRFEAVFQESMDVVVVIRIADGQILAVSNAVRVFLGYSPNMLIGRPFACLFPPTNAMSDDESLQVVFNAVLVDQPFLRADGDIEIMDVTATMIAWDHNKAALLTIRNTSERRAAEAEKAAITAQLKAALDEVKRLSGFLPICSHCKRIRDEQGDWFNIEDYICSNSEADFSHGICPQCLKQHYSEYDI